LIAFVCKSKKYSLTSRSYISFEHFAEKHVHLSVSAIPTLDRSEEAEAISRSQKDMVNQRILGTRLRCVAMLSTSSVYHALQFFTIARSLLSST